METKQRCQCKECKIKPHYSDCAVHNEPAFPNEDCNCNFMTHDTERARISEILVKWGMSTNQAAISEIVALMKESYKKGLHEQCLILDTEMSEMLKGTSDLSQQIIEDVRKSERTALREKVEKMKRVIPSRHDRGSSKLNILALEEIRTAEGYNQALSEVLDLLNQ